MDCKILKFSRHALKRMFEQGIPEPEVEEIVLKGEVIEEYPEDTPYSSQLLLGYFGRRPLHVVVAYDRGSGLCVVITAYVPDATQWGEDFRIRR
jgi:hypothetical protein